MKHETIGTKIAVLGCSGSGKSTFSRRLQERTGLPLYHLDMIWWKPDHTHITRAAFDLALEKLTQSERWILDGDYSRTYETRIRACDTVIFLDFGEAVCLDGITQRVGQTRPDMPWVEERPDPELLELVRSYEQSCRPKLLALLERYPEKQAIVFRTRAEADEWLAGPIRLRSEKEEAKP